MDLLDIVIAKQLAGGGGGSGTDNYNDLSNLPKINDVTLSGNKSSSALGLQSEITSENKLDSDLIDDTNQDNKFVTSTEKNTWNAKQNAIDADHKLNADYVDDSTSTNKFVTASDKEAWNAKQSAIDSDHKLSSSLVSFSTAEATALASGIDSNKVEQIGTNQTNILYNLQNGVKNLFNLEADERWSYSLSSLTVDTKTGTLSITSNSDWARVGIPITLPAGNYVISGNVTSLVGNALLMGNTEKYDSGTAVFTNIEITTTGAFTANFTLNSATTFWVTLYANYSESVVSNSVTITGMMICTKAAWDQEPNVFRPFALPNYDLTVREQQDRNALVEVIDKGAKNQLTIPDIETLKALNIEAGVTSGTWNGNSFTYKGVTFTINYTDNTITTSGTSTIDHERIVINKFTFKSNNDYMISGCPSGGSYSGYSIAMLNYNNRDTGGGLEVEGDDVTRYLVVYAQNSGTDMSGLTFKPMICTPDEWKISRNHEPYALPNTDLTRMMTPFFTVPINHNMIYRGQNLGETFTEAQDTALSSGNFTDLYLGDYWTKQITIPAFYEVTTAEPADWSTNYTSYYTKSGDTYTPVSGDTAPTWAANTYYERLVPSQTVTLKAVIADFDTFYGGYNSSYATINTHHAAVIVTGFNNVVWNKTNTTAGGYVNSLIHKWLVGSALPQIEIWFGSAKVLSHQKLLTNAITGDAASGWAWSSQKISLLSENQMYGSKVWGGSKASNGGYEPGEAFKHLNVFNHIDANLLFGNKNIWLRDIASAGWAACLNSCGLADSSGASHTWVAPAALILLS